MSHAFFAEVLAGGAIHSADRTRGKFRSYLLGAVKHFVSRHHESARRGKRGGGAQIRTLDAEAASVADANQRSPNVDFDRQWAAPPSPVEAAPSPLDRAGDASSPLSAGGGGAADTGERRGVASTICSWSSWTA